MAICSVFFVCIPGLWKGEEICPAIDDTIVDDFQLSIYILRDQFLQFYQQQSGCLVTDGLAMQVPFSGESLQG